MSRDDRIAEIERRLVAIEQELDDVRSGAEPPIGWEHPLGLGAVTKLPGAAGRALQRAEYLRWHSWELRQEDAALRTELELLGGRSSRLEPRRKGRPKGSGRPSRERLVSKYEALRDAAEDRLPTQQELADKTNSFSEDAGISRRRPLLIVRNLPLATSA